MVNHNFVLFGALLSLPAYSEPTIEMMNITINGQPKAVVSSLNDPVLITGVATRNDIEPGVVSASKNQNEFSVRFREWDYLQDSVVHGQETIPLMFVEKGLHVMADGSVWEAGTFELNGQEKQIQFQNKFKHAPIVLLSANSENDSSTFALRLEGVTRYGFTARLQEQEANNSSTHAMEEIAYLAVYSPENEGRTSDNQSYAIDQIILDNNLSDLFGYSVWIEEEQSKDLETQHVQEAVSAIWTSVGLFAQTGTIYGGDTETLALAVSHESPALMVGTGSQRNIALLHYNGLTMTSYSASNTYGLDDPAGAFDGYTKSDGQINSDALEKIKRGHWVSGAPNGTNQWLQVDFGKNIEISSFRIFCREGYLTRCPKNVTLQRSNDGVTFMDVQSFQFERTLEQSFSLTHKVSARTFRLFIHDTYGDDTVQIEEWEIFAD